MYECERVVCEKVACKSVVCASVACAKVVRGKPVSQTTRWRGRAGFDSRKDVNLGALALAVILGWKSSVGPKHTQPHHPEPQANEETGDITSVCLVQEHKAKKQTRIDRHMRLQQAMSCALGASRWTLPSHVAVCFMRADQRHVPRKAR